MKRCPECGRDYNDDSLSFCLDDGSELLYGPASGSRSSAERATAILSESGFVAGGFPSGSQRTKFLRNEDGVAYGISNSIAVLPFANLSADADNEYFCDGLAEELLYALAKIDDLKVAARTSAFSFKGKNVNVGEIGRILNVKTVLDGSVRREGPRVRITVQLINAADGYHIWSERYDREMSSIFDVQDEITLAVVEALKLKMLGNQKDAVLKRYTENTEAYELYLKGRFHYQKYTPEDWFKAIDFFEQAIAKEPEYAPAWANLASVLAYCWWFYVLPRPETSRRWLESNQRALELDPNLDDAHSTMARYHFYFERNWTLAEAEFLRALAINRDNAEVWQQYGIFLAVMGRKDEALNRARKAFELDPLSLMNNLQTGWVHLFSGHIDEVLETDRRLLEMEPNFQFAYWQRGLCFLAKKMYRESLDAFEKAMAIAPSPDILSHFGAVHGELGNLDEATKAVDALIEMRKRQPVAAYSIARVYSKMGRLDEAFEWLEVALQENDGELCFINVEITPSEPGTFGIEIRQDPRFADILDRVGLPQA